MSLPNSLLRPPLLGDAGSPCGRFEIRCAFLIDFPADAIVNVTNQQMVLNTTVVPGGEFQIHYAAGPQLKDHLNTHLTSHPHGLPVGEALTTPSFSMPSCHFLIHTSAPNYRTRTCENILLIQQQLADCYRRCLEEAFLHNVSSIAFPAIGTGKMLGWPRAVASRIAVDTCRRWFGHPVFGRRRREV
ncbi:macro domain-like protein [Acephala macrosclerotiorum]|nr:macro domain-like protein [Acephala macrosclerotiorum]